MKKAIIKLETLACPSCMQKIENALKGLDGIDRESVKVMFNSSKVKLTFDSDIVTIEAIEKAIEELGYPVIKATVKAA
ncbi:heavy-metal-associated domain-containing protein [Alkalibacterium sp. f15]|uniref:heavy-metal-associated domain-containing protein n=1 Tax=Alkalibacterium sp. f15 TaxID=3414029 RepID=UPI003BF8F656